MDLIHTSGNKLELCHAFHSRMRIWEDVTVDQICFGSVYGAGNFTEIHIQKQYSKEFAVFQVLIFL